MTQQQKPSKTIHIALWIAQVVLAVFFIIGAIMKFQPIETIAAKMPWTGQAPVLVVRLLGVLDLVGATGLILPSLLRIKPRLTPWAAVGIMALMACAIIFHVSRGEASVIGVNIVIVVIAAFVAWGRLARNNYSPGE
jgi:hypothetical protein